MNPIARHVILSLTVLVRLEIFAASISSTVTVDGPLDALSTTIDMTADDACVGMHAVEIPSEDIPMDGNRRVANAFICISDGSEYVPPRSR